MELQQPLSTHPYFNMTLRPETIILPEMAIRWVRDNMYLGYLAIFLYLLMVYFGPRFMKNRAAIELKYPLIAWNLFIAVASFIGATRTVPDFLYILNSYGLHRAVCTKDTLNHQVGQFWGFLFTLSKVFEMGDTLFLILRKRRVIFLHWYHHITVLLLTWYCYVTQSAPGRVFGLVNVTIHAFMYSYFALKGLGINIPKLMSLLLTLVQISQMFLGFYVSLFALKQIYVGLPCDVSPNTAVFAVAVYISYFTLFCRYFYLVYMAPRKFIHELGLSGKKIK